MKDKKIIWSNLNININEWQDYLEEVENAIGEKLNEYEKYEKIANLLDEYFQDEVTNLNIKTDNNIIAIASLGLWNGRKKGYKLLSNNVNSILNGFDCDYIEIYADKYNIKFKGIHHDGQNYIEFREIREGVNIDNLLNDIYIGKTISRQKLNYYTKSILHYIAGVYGW